MGLQLREQFDVPVPCHCRKAGLSAVKPLRYYNRVREALSTLKFVFQLNGPFLLHFSCFGGKNAFATVMGKLHQHFPWSWVHYVMLATVSCYSLLLMQF